MIDKSKETPTACCGCQRQCESGMPARWRRQNTAYHDDTMNWICACDDCAKEIDVMWQDMWDEYYAVGFRPMLNVHLGCPMTVTT